MADPARQKHPEIEPDIRPQLGVIQGGGESSPPTGNLSEVNPAPDLKEREEKFGIIHGGGESTEDRADLRPVSDQEDNPLNYVPSGREKTPQSFSKRASLFVRKRAASISITAILGVFGIGASFFGAPSLLLVHVKEVLTNYGSSASRAADSRFENSLYYRLRGGTASACRKPGAISTVRCVRGTMTKKNHQKLIDSGFDVESKKVGGRYVIKGVSKDGVSLNGKSSRANIKAAMAHPDFGSSMHRAINARANVFNGGRFSSKILNFFGADKSKVDPKGSTDKERKDSVNKLTGAADEDTEDKRKAKFEGKYGSKIKGVSKAGTGLGAVGGVGCSTLNMARVGLTATKLFNAARYASFALLFLKAADQIKANGEIDPTTLALLGGVLTSYYTSGPMKGLTATDSQGFKVAAYGGETKLKSFSQRFLLGGNEKLIDLDNTIKTFQNKVPGGKSTLKTGCRAVTDPVAGTAMTGVTCGIAAVAGGGTGFVAGTVVPVAGNIFGGAAGTVVGAAACVAIGVTASIAFGTVIGKVFDHILPRIVNALSDAPIDVNKIKGVEAGDALAAGAGVILEKNNASRGLQPGTKSSVTAFQSDTSEDQKNYDMIARYDAQKEPLNAYSEYSFLGSLVRKSGLVNLGSGSLATNVSTLSNVLLSSMRFSPVASADSSMPVNISAEDLSHCPDRDLKDIGVDCDVVGGTQYTMATDIPVEDNLNFMEGVHADDTGEPISEEYKKWVANCTEQRTDPMGSTSVGIEYEDEWATGEACVAGSSAKINQTTRDNFSTYYYDNGAQEDEDYEAPESVTPSGEVGTLMVGSYNVRTSTLDNADFGDPDKVYDAEDEQRMAGIANIIEQKQLAIVGTQEVRGKEKQGLLNSLPSHYKGTPLSGGKHEMSDVIFYDSRLFKQVGFGTYSIPKQGARLRDAVWAKLQTASGNSVYVFNMHASLNPSEQETAAKNTLAEIRRVVGSSGDPVIVMGDMNSNDVPPENKVKLTFEASGILTYTRDATTDRKGYNCDTISSPADGGQDCGREGGRGSHRDQMWVSSRNNITINSWENIANAETLKLSDHNPIIISMDIPSLDTDSAESVEGGMAWPLDKKYWLDNRADFLGPHTAGSDTFTGVGRDLATDISSPPEGSPVYAMFGGKVTKDSLSGGHGLIISTPIQGGVLEVAYAHGPRTNQDTEYKAGDKIMTVGCLGNCRGVHLHIDMAFNGKGVCPQDVFLALDSGQTPDFKTLASKAAAPCEGRG